MPMVGRIFRWLAAALLFVVAYLHLALMTNGFGLAGRLGKPFLLNAIGAFVALLVILVVPRWYGWALGILVSGGAAFAKLGLHRIPGLAALIFGGGMPGAHAGPPPGPASPPPGGPLHTAGRPPAPPPGGGPHGHHVLPLLGNLRSLGGVAVSVEIAFVALALVALVVIGGSRRPMRQ
jgi:hypothetical protein